MVQIGINGSFFLKVSTERCLVDEERAVFVAYIALAMLSRASRKG